MFVSALPDPTCNSEKSANGGNKQKLLLLLLLLLLLTQSQVGIVGLKIANSLNRSIKFRKRNRLLVTFVVFLTALWTFLTLNTLTQLYFKKAIHISDQYHFEKLPNN